ncbi:MAG TPA: hypothetical protein PKA10_04005 [Selenomonadales bacterium]|nr:hypothetical protein [Selenomonadales bacterium]
MTNSSDIIPLDHHFLSRNLVLATGQTNRTFRHPPRPTGSRTYPGDDAGLFIPQSILFPAFLSLTENLLTLFIKFIFAFILQKIKESIANTCHGRIPLPMAAYSEM